MNLRIILILGALSAFAPLAIDFYLPGFPAMASAFATDEKHIQLTLAVYFAGLAIGQLIYGPLADHPVYPRVFRLCVCAVPGMADRCTLRAGPWRVCGHGDFPGGGQ